MEIIQDGNEERSGLEGGHVLTLVLARVRHRGIIHFGLDQSEVGVCRIGIDVVMRSYAGRQLVN